MSDGAVSKTDFAKLAGITKGRVSQLVSLGLPTRPDGLIEVAPAKAWISANIRRPVRGGATSAAADDGDYAAARLKLTLAQAAKTLLEADRAEVALERERGSVVDREMVKRLVRDWNTKIKTGLLNFASRRGPEGAAALGIDEVAFVSWLEVAMRQHMAEMADEPLPMGVQAEVGVSAGEYGQSR